MSNVLNPPRGQATSAAPPLKPLAKVMAVTSGKGGVGKTFVSANLAAAMAKRGLRVLVLAWQTWMWCLTCTPSSPCMTCSQAKPN